MKKQPTATLPDQAWVRFLRTYDELKARPEYADSVLLFRVGDFYEAMDADAETVAAVIGITKLPFHGTGRVNCGVPYHAIDRTIEQLVAAGHRVAMADPT